MIKFTYQCSECGRKYEITPDRMLCPECSQKQETDKPLRGILEVAFDGPAAIIYDEAENRLHTAKAVMALTIGGRP